MAAPPPHDEFLFQYSDHEQYYKQVTGANNINHFAGFDELLDFSGEEEGNFLTQNFCNNSSSSPAGKAATSTCGSSSSSSCFSSTHAQFASPQVDLYCVPSYEDLAELEWLSNFVEDSFNSTQHQIININPPTTTTTKPDHHPIKIHPGKARSKRSRSAPCDWSSRLLLLSPAPVPAHSTNNRASSSAAAAEEKMRRRKREGERKCLHCGSEKTPQWRTGPMGGKTLCNACGVRYKSGRLVPEYRPAASPTFISTKHSNSHRKVLDLRRHNQIQQQQQLFGSRSTKGSSILLFGLSHSHAT